MDLRNLTVVVAIIVIAEGAIILSGLNDGPQETDENDDVRPSDDSQYGLRSVWFDIDRMTMLVGESEELECNCYPSQSNPKITWSSSDRSVATVENGVITAISEGEAVIKAVGNGGGQFRTATCDIVVVNKPGVYVNIGWYSILAGYDDELEAEVVPKDLGAVTWSSSDTSVIVMKGNILKAVGGGNAVITAQCGDYSYSFPAHVTWATLNEVRLDKFEMVLMPGETEKLKHSVDPMNANPAVTWTSSDESVATVKDGMISAISDGVATVTATGEEGISKTCMINVVSDPGLYLDASLIELPTHSGVRIEARVIPESSEPVVWSSTDTSVAKVVDGYITIEGEGTAVITAACGSFSDSCTVICKDGY